MNRKGHLGAAVLSLGITQHFLAPMILTTENIIIALACTIAGGKVPDLDFYFKYFYAKAHRNKRYLYHRQFTHSLLLICGLLLFSILSQAPYAPYLFYFSVGLVSHVITDMLTGTVPIFVTGNHMGPFRIGIKYDPIKKFFVSVGEMGWIPMIIIGLVLLFITPADLGIKEMEWVKKILQFK